MPLTLFSRLFRLAFGSRQCFPFTTVGIENCLHGEVEKGAYPNGRQKHCKIFHGTNSTFVRLGRTCQSCFFMGADPHRGRIELPRLRHR